MAKWKEPTGTELTAQVSSVDPRVRMKEIRQDLNAFVDQKANPWGISHLGELYDDEADKTRLIIALQDKLEDTSKRHKKATNHIVQLLADMNNLQQQFFNASLQLAIAEANVRKYDAAGIRLMAQHNELQKIHGETVREVETLKHKLVTTMQTLSLSIDMSKGHL